MGFNLLIRPWVMSMKWHDLAFLHWPVRPETLAPLLPPGLELDTFQGSAYLGLVPFRMSGVRLRGTPALPRLSAFPEMNIRTYVRCGVWSGVWFFSLDATQRLAVEVARRAFFLPYFRATMSCHWDQGWCYYANRRVSALGVEEPHFKARYRPIGEPATALPGTLAHWLTERYCLFSYSPRGQLYRGDVMHDPWQLQQCEVEIDSMDMVSWLNDGGPPSRGAAGGVRDGGSPSRGAGSKIELSGPPLAHFSQLQEVQAWAIAPALQNDSCLVEMQPTS